MIRERVSTHGIIRPLEPESELSAFSLPPERIGQVSELAMRRFFDAKTKFDKKFGRTYKSIEKHRLKHIERAKKDAMRNMTQLQNYINQDEKREGETLKGVKEGLVASGSWSWAWALDVDEKPPPSSIVARRDTHEAVELARIADQAVLADEDMLSEVSDSDLTTLARSLDDGNEWSDQIELQTLFGGPDTAEDQECRRRLCDHMRDALTRADDNMCCASKRVCLISDSVSAGISSVVPSWPQPVTSAAIHFSNFYCLFCH